MALALLMALTCAAAFAQAPTAPPQEPPAQTPQPSPAETPEPQKPAAPSDTVQVPAGEAAQSEAGTFTIRTQVREVTLHATVVDDKDHLVTTLGREAFTVYEDGAPQPITSFRHEDIPIAVGIVIDNSGSMREKRPSVNQAALNFVRASNPQDEVFVVNFNQDFYLDQDFTGDLTLLRDALERIEARGITALFDAVVASADHLVKNGRLQKKILLVITDGEDNASVSCPTMEQAIRKLAIDGGPTIYTIGILGNDSGAKKARRALKLMAEETGGLSFFPKDLTEVDAITRQVAHDVRNQYTLGYKPPSKRNDNTYRTVKVMAKDKDHKHLQVRTRSGYYAGSPLPSTQK